MDSYLLILSQYLVLAFFWVGVPFSLLGMLLLLGFQWKHPISVAVTVIGLIGFACWILGLSIEGLVTGEALTISRSTGFVSKSQNPFGYWVATIFSFSSASFIVGFSCWAIYRVLKKPNLAFKRDALKRAP
jgi:hypothetical protein